MTTEHATSISTLQLAGRKLSGVCDLVISKNKPGNSPSSFINVSSSKHSSTQEGRTICFRFGLLISHGKLMRQMNILRCQTRKLGITPRIIIVYNDMGKFGIIQFGSDGASILAERLGRSVQSGLSAASAMSYQWTYLSVTSSVGSERLRPFFLAFSTVST